MEMTAVLCFLTFLIVTVLRILKEMLSDLYKFRRARQERPAPVL
jgi:hypothetical protein